MEVKTIRRSDLGDSQYIKELELILEDMSEQAEVMFEAFELAMSALHNLHQYYETKPEYIDGESAAEHMYRLTDLALTMLKGEPEADEHTH